MHVILKKYSDIRFYYLRITSRAIQCEAIGPQQWFCLKNVRSTAPSQTSRYSFPGIADPRNARKRRKFAFYGERVAFSLFHIPAYLSVLLRGCGADDSPGMA